MVYLSYIILPRMLYLHFFYGADEHYGSVLCCRNQRIIIISIEKNPIIWKGFLWDFIQETMDLLPDTQNCMLRMRREVGNVFPATAG